MNIETLIALAVGLFAGGWFHRIWPWTNLIKKPAE